MAMHHGFQTSPHNKSLPSHNSPPNPSEERHISLQKQLAVAQIAHELAHEINNPLEALTNILYLLKRAAQVPEDVKRHEEAERQLSRLATLVHSILAIEDDEGGNIESASQLLDPGILRQYKRRYEEAMHLAAVVEGAQDAIYSKKLDGTIMAWNAGAELLFGYSSSEALGRKITMLVPRKAAKDERLIMGKLRQGQRIETHETVRRTKEGKLICVSVTISPIFSPSGKVVGASTIARRSRVQKN